MLGGNADGSGTPLAVPVAKALGPSVAPLRGLKQTSLLVVAPFSLSPQVLAAVARQPGVTGTEPINTTDSELVLNLTPKSATDLGLTGFAAKMFPIANIALANDNPLGADWD